MVVQLSKHFVKVAKRLAVRAAKSGILPPVVAIGRGRAEVSDGFVVLSVPADHEGPIAGFDPRELRATHGATVGRAGDVSQGEAVVSEAVKLKGEWPDFAPLFADGTDLHEPFTVEAQLLIDALEGLSGDVVQVYLPTRAGKPVVILGANGERALLMPQQKEAK